MLSDDGVPLEQISRLVGHSGTTVTELIYRKQIRPVVDDGAAAMNRIVQHTGTRLRREILSRPQTTDGLVGRSAWSL